MLPWATGVASVVQTAERHISDPRAPLSAQDPTSMTPSPCAVVTASATTVPEATDYACASWVGHWPVTARAPSAMRATTVRTVTCVATTSLPTSQHRAIATATAPMVAPALESAPATLAGPDRIVPCRALLPMV